MSNKIAIVTKEDLSLVDDNSLNEKQLQQILKRTPQHYKKTRPAKGGGNWTYVTGGYVKKCLNIMFGWDWDFEIIKDNSDSVLAGNSKEIIVLGKLTCRSNGRVITKMQYGNKDVAFKRNSDIPLSVGNDLKAAATDSLKKCASEIGIAADVYNADEFKEVNIVEKPKKRENLTPKHPKWQDVIQILNDGNNTIEGIEKLYKLSDSNKQKLIDNVEL